MFFNTSPAVFMSPLPNTRIWTSPTLGLLQQQECFMSGGLKPNFTVKKEKEKRTPLWSGEKLQRIFINPFLRMVARFAFPGCHRQRSLD
jgi:hypothetical protein